MKKLITLAMALLLCFALVSCGGVDTQPAIDAFNAANTAFTALANDVNAEIDAYDEEFLELLYEMSDVLAQQKELLEGDTDLTEEQVTEMVSALKGIEDWCNETHPQLDVLKAAAALTSLAETYDETVAAFDALATKVNENLDTLDPEVVPVMNTMHDSLVAAGEAILSDVEVSAQQAAELEAALTEIHDWVIRAENELFH
ncbi:MAG: hypothetical protein IJC43_08825 [Clostridia bacterium]|nr:hypothetical protein [Clostridia bacterium]